MRKVILPIVILSLLFGVISFAQETGLPNPGLTPDSPFYFFDTLGKKISLFFTFDPVKKAQKAVHYAEERIAEAKVMAEKNKPDATERANQNYREFLELANKKTQEAKEKGKDVEELATSITEKTLKHQEVLIEIFEKVPDEAKTAIQKAIEVSRKGSEQAVQAVTGAKKEELLQKIEQIKTEAEERIKVLEEKLKKAEERIKELEEKLKEKEVPKEIPKKIEEKPINEAKKEITPLCQPDTSRGYKMCSDLSKESVVQPESKYCAPLPAQVVDFINECKTKYEQPILSYNKDEKGCITQCCSCELLVLKEEKPTTVAPKEEPTLPQELISGEIQLDLSSVGDENVKSYLIAWYNKTYPILKSITDGPCQPFKASVNYSPVGGGGSFLASALGQNATIVFGMPLDDSTRNGRFDSRFGHEFSHGFMNGIRAVGTAPRGGLVTASFITEGFAEMVVSSALFELFKTGQTSYKGVGFYLPYVVASYDSFAIQGKDVAGGALMWKGEYTGYYYEQAEAIWYLLEQAKPGFVKEFMKETCSLPQKSVGGPYVIYLSYDQFKEILIKIFGNTKIEGKNVLDWFNAQPITNINGASGNFIRIQFDGKTGIGSDVEGRSINPGKITITAVERIQDPGEGPKDTKLSVSPVVKLTDWQGRVTNLEARSGAPASAMVPSLPSGAHKVEVSDSNLDAKTITYFVVASAVDEDSLYGIKLNNGEIVSSGTIKTSLGDAQITNGFFTLKVPENIKEVNFLDNNRIVIKPAGMTRMIILP